jgi:hypothetical protein
MAILRLCAFAFRYCFELPELISGKTPIRQAFPGGLSLLN